jgi:hypothetical protein
MTNHEAIEELKAMQNVGDTEADHIGADGVLCQLLETLGFGDVVAEYEKVPKWYA